MIDLQMSREKIDKIDDEILKLFEERMNIAKDVAEYKITVGKQVYDRTREMEKLEKLRNKAENTFNEHGVEELFSQIMAISRKLQYTLVSGLNDDIVYEEQEKLHIEQSTKVACFGERGSYTEQAMEEFFGEDINRLMINDFKEIMELLRNHVVDYGVLPIENSSTGGITDIYDLLSEYEEISIVGEHIIKVNQNLLTYPGAKFDDIKQVYSHPQGLLQCRKFFEPYPEIELLEWESTSAAAKKVRDSKDKTMACISNKRAGKIYGLVSLAENINDESLNATRFIIITNKKIFIQNANKVSIHFTIPHESGSLYNILSHFIYNDLNMTKIQSRPISGKSWEYRFFVEFEGNLKEAAVKNALTGIKAEAASLKILGNFQSL